MRTFSINNDSNSNSNMNNNEIPNIGNQGSGDLPDLNNLKKRTNRYPIFSVYFTPERVKKVPDLMNGGLRKRKFALILGIGAIPDFHKMEDPPMVETMRVPQVLIDADSIDDLKKAAINEITKICGIMQKFVDGEITSEEDLDELEKDEDEENDHD